MSTKAWGAARVTRTRANVWVGWVALLVSLAATHAARADANRVREALEALVPYDLEGPRTFEVLRTISSRARTEPNAQVRHVLQFVHVVALTDLWILGHKTQGTALLDRVANVLGVVRAEAPRTLLGLLDRVKDPIVADIVRDSRNSLLLTSPQLGKVSAPTPVGPRTSVLYIDDVISSVAAAFGMDTAAVTTLARLAEDPCPLSAACTDLYRPFDSQGRKAIKALETAITALRTLREDVMMRDPFVQTIAARIEANAALLPGTELAPNVRIDRASERAHLTAHGAPATPELIAFLEPGKLEVSFVPRVRVTPTGNLELIARGTPVFPAARQVALGKSFPLVVRTIDEVVATFTQLREQAPDGRIAIAAAPDSPSHLWARVLLSAKSARFSRVAMLGVGDDGTMRSRDVDVVSSLDAESAAPADLSVVVRLGGFTVQRTGPVPSVSLPRVKRETGFAFDFTALASSAGQVPAKTAKVSFMSDVAAQVLAETAFVVAPRDGALTVVLP